MEEAFKPDACAGKASYIDCEDIIGIIRRIGIANVVNTLFKIPDKYSIKNVSSSLLIFSGNKSVIQHY